MLNHVKPTHCTAMLVKFFLINHGVVEKHILLAYAQLLRIEITPRTEGHQIKHHQGGQLVNCLILLR
jgi:hypothetical protein